MTTPETHPSGGAVHPKGIKLAAAMRKLSRRIERVARSIDVRSANGWGATRTSRSAGWPSDHETIRTSAEPCFVLSSGRSGTMTLTQLGALCEDLHSVHEPLPHLLTESFLYYSNAVGDDEFWRSVVAEARDWRLRDAYRAGRNWFETNNRLTFLAPILAAHYPRSRFIVLVRHPVAFAESALARGYYAEHPWDFARIVPRETDPAAMSWDSMSQLEKIGWLWRATYQTADDVVATLEPHRSLLLKAEDLFAQQNQAVNQFYSYVSARPRPDQRRIDRVLRTPANAQTERTARASVTQWASTERDRFLSLVGDRMRSYGYKTHS